MPAAWAVLGAGLAEQRIEPVGGGRPLRRTAFASLNVCLHLLMELTSSRSGFSTPRQAR